MKPKVTRYYLLFLPNFVDEKGNYLFVSQRNFPPAPQMSFNAGWTLVADSADAIKIENIDDALRLAERIQGTNIYTVDTLEKVSFTPFSSLFNSIK